MKTYAADDGGNHGSIVLPCTVSLQPPFVDKNQAKHQSRSK